MWVFFIHCVGYSGHFHSGNICLIPEDFLFMYFKDFIYLFLEGGDRREKERKRNINVRQKHQSVASCMLPTGDLVPKSRTRPDQESKMATFQFADAQTTEPRQSGLILIYFKCFFFFSCFLELFLVQY